MQNAALSRRVFPYSIPQTFAGPVEEYQQEDPAHNRRDGRGDDYHHRQYVDQRDETQDRADHHQGRAAPIELPRKPSPGCRAQVAFDLKQAGSGSTNQVDHHQTQNRSDYIQHPDKNREYAQHQNADLHIEGGAVALVGPGGLVKANQEQDDTHNGGNPPHQRDDHQDAEDLPVEHLFQSAARNGIVTHCSSSFRSTKWTFRWL